MTDIPQRNGSTQELRARDLYEQGKLVEAARREASACERDGYDVTAAILRDLADIAEAKGAHDG